MERVLRKYLSMFIEKIRERNRLPARQKKTVDYPDNSKKEGKNLRLQELTAGLGFPTLTIMKRIIWRSCSVFMNREEVRSRHYRSCMIKRLGNYKINVHSLKGQSLTIGAKELSKRAKRMQDACEHGDENYIIQNHTELIADYCSILDGLSKYVTVGEEKIQCRNYRQQSTILTRQRQ